MREAMAQVKSNDIVILKRGLYLIVAVGIVVERARGRSGLRGQELAP